MRMDNLTHTLIGALIGETTAHCSRPAPNGLSADLRRTLLVGCAAVGSNLPDSDLLYSYFGPKVNYLVHHRGHTHTLVGAVLLGALVYALILWWLRRRRIESTPLDRAWIAGTLGLSALLHIGMDFMNNYGVHPFWPADSRWRYGDSVFIIEPLLWVACAPLIVLLKARWARALALILPALGFAFLFSLDLLSTALGLFVIGLAGAMLLVARVVQPQIALALGLAIWLGATGLFAASSSVAARRIEETAAREFPRSELLDHVLSPMPANPLCWEVLLIQRDQGEITLRRVMLALAPELVRADACGRGRFSSKTTAPLTTVESADAPALQWHGEIRTSIRALAEISGRDCTANAALRFMRTPYLTERDGKRILGDLRYDRELGLGFAEIELGSDTCPAFVPGWSPPRADLLSPPEPAANLDDS
jgi:inner membrane protein